MWMLAAALACSNPAPEATTTAAGEHPQRECDQRCSEESEQQALVGRGKVS